MDIKFRREVKKDGETVFDLKIVEGDSTTKHMVSVKDSTFERLVEKEVSKRDLVEESFKFLLDREPKESILSSFELGVIERYFPEYPEEMGERFSC